MTRDSAVITAVDNRCHSRISVVPNVSTTLTNGITTNSSSSNSDVVTPGDEGGSPKSSSVLSTASSSVSSDDDDCPVRTVKAYNCHELLSSIRKPKVEDHNSLVDKDSFSSGKTDDSTSIEGRLTFYKDGKFIFQLEAHQQLYKNGSAITSSCRWIPVSTDFQQQKNKIEKWSQLPQNKTIWPYLVINPSSDSKSPQTIQLSPQPSLVKSEGRWNQQNRKSMKPLPLELTSNNAIDIVSPTTSCSVVMATTMNIARRPPRKCSTTSNLIDRGTINLQHMIHRHLQCQLSQSSQHQTFMMYANNTVKAQRRMLLFPKKRYCRRGNKITAISKTSFSLQKERQPLVNLESIVRYLWGRQHTTELFLRKKVSLNNSIVNGNATIDSVNITHPPNHLTTGKRRSTAVNNTGGSFTTMTMNRNNSPRKKYKMEQKPAVTLVSSNNHSITAILSGGSTTIGQTKHKSNLPDGCFITSSKPVASSFTLQKNFPSSLLRTLLKNSSEESSGGSSFTLTNNSNIFGAVGEYLQPNVSDNRKRSVDKNNCQPNVADAGLVIDSVHRLPPILHHPATSTAGQLAAGYFNMLYHQAGIAAAIAYQTRAQLPSKSQLPSSQFPVSDAWQLQSNSRHILPPLPEVVGGSGVTSTTILSPYSSLVSATVASRLPSNISLPLQPFPIHLHQNLLVKQQNQPSELGSNGVDEIKEMKNIVDLDKDCSFTDCVPLNLSKDSATENVESPTNNTATVR